MLNKMKTNKSPYTEISEEDYAKYKDRLRGFHTWKNIMEAMTPDEVRRLFSGMDDMFRIAEDGAVEVKPLFMDEDVNVKELK